jgi:hypothetical protein
MRRLPAGIPGILLLLMVQVVPADAQTTPPPPPVSVTVTLPDAIDVSKIKAGLAQPAPVVFDTRHLNYYLDIFNHQPSFMDFVGSFDLKNGPTPHAGMTHQDFLDQVSPKNFYFGSPSVKNVAELGALGLGGNYVLRKLVDALHHAPSEAEAKRIRAQIDRELAALGGK